MSVLRGVRSLENDRVIIKTAKYKKQLNQNNTMFTLNLLFSLITAHTTVGRYATHGQLHSTDSRGKHHRPKRKA